jgi:hypothetical protein
MPELVFKIISCPLAAVPQVAERIAEYGERAVLDLCGSLAEPPLVLTLQHENNEQLEELKEFLLQAGVEFSIAAPEPEPKQVADEAEESSLSDAESLPEEDFAATEDTADLDSGFDTAVAEDREEAVSQGIILQHPPPLPQHKAVEEQDGEEIIYWERNTGASPLLALWSTWKAAIFTPVEFFSGLPQKGGLGYAFAYALIAAIIYTILSLPSAMSDFGQQMQGLSELQPFMELLNIAGLNGLPLGPTEITPMTLLSQTLASLIVLPVGLFYFLLILAGTYHLIVLLVRGQGSFEQTFKVIAYSLSVLAFAPVPIAGTIIIIIYGFVVAVVGFREVHKVQTSTAVLIALAPLFIIFTTVLLSFMAAGLTLAI